MGRIADPSFWKGKRVFVTGDTGFKGSWLCLWLKHMGAEVFGMSAPPPHTVPSLYNLAGLKDMKNHYDGGVQQLVAVKHAMTLCEPDIVFHLAAQAIVWKAYEEPQHTFETNVMGTVNVLEAVRKCPSVKALVCITSDKCYTNREWIWGYRENDELGGDDPYAASKAAAEMAIRGYAHYFQSDRGCSVASARAGNVIGGGDWAPDRLVPDIVRALQANEPIKLRHPEATRPWQHVLEPLNGYLLLAEDHMNGAFNFGPSKANISTVGDVVAKAVEVWGEGSFVLDEAEAKAKGFHENTFLGLDSTKAKRWLNWETLLCFEETVSQTIQWYADVVKGVPAYESCMEQIEDYMAIREAIEEI